MQSFIVEITFSLILWCFQVYALLTDDQKRLHPSVKQALEKNLNDDMKFSPHRPQRKKKHIVIDIFFRKFFLWLFNFLFFRVSLQNSSQNTTIVVDSNIDSLRTIKTETNKSNHEERESSDLNNFSNMKMPMYIEPKVSDDNVLKIDSGRANKQKQKFRIIIG